MATHPTPQIYRGAFVKLPEDRIGKIGKMRHSKWDVNFAIFLNVLADMKIYVYDLDD